MRTVDFDYQKDIFAVFVKKKEIIFEISLFSFLTW